MTWCLNGGCVVGGGSDDDHWKRSHRVHRPRVNIASAVPPTPVATLVLPTWLESTAMPGVPTNNAKRRVSPD
jgi:hypothetical protein